MRVLEEALRREAVRRRLGGESAEAIARDLGRSRQWVAKWVARYDAGDAGWARARSRAARRVANRTDGETEGRVLAVRARLERNPWAQVGAAAIAWELEKLGVDPPPKRTIERILARGEATRRERPRRRKPKGIPYPAPAAGGAGEVVQLDLVGPRHLTGDVRFHALNQIDLASHEAGIEIVEHTDDRRVVLALQSLWLRFGVPARVQFDNGGPFVAPKGLGEVVRVCLHQGTTPVFIPAGEPWRNGTIEHFNDTFDRLLLRSERFADLAHLQQRAGAFERFHNTHHRYRATAGRTPAELAPEQTRPPLELSQIPAGWPKQGRVEFIRFIRSDHRLRLPGRSLTLPDGNAYRYVTATLDLAAANEGDNLQVTSTDGELIASTRLPLPRR